jgi:hypothetical protein
MKRKSLLSLALLILSASATVGQKISHDELVEILEIKSWRIPMPKDENLEWSIQFVDYGPRKSSAVNFEKLTPDRKALIVLRNMGTAAYRYTLKQTAGTGSGDMEIRICTDQKVKAKECDNSYTISWFDDPKPLDDGTKFVIAEIAQMVGRKPVKQIILVPVRYRL